ncbi:MAG: ABC transporter substrate-binding protein [Dehalococcoidia bacterium]|nr:MAG: ABC transporter substrate-binding protein [Dehalococcoidia bacterium]
MLRRVVAIASLAGLLAAACAPASPQAQPAAPGQPAQPPKDFKLRVGLSAQAATLDPHFSIGNNMRRFGLFEALVGYDESSRFIPSLASEWRSVDPTTWQFKLTPGRKFSDGTPITADDVKWNFERVINPELRLGVTTRVLNIAGATIVDPQTVNVTTKAPDPIALHAVAAVAILPKAYFERIGAADFGLKPVGSGPFMLKEFIPNDRITMVPNPNHPKPAIASEMTIRMLPEASARVAGLRGGELDIVNGISLDQVEQLRSQGFQVVNNTQGSDIGAFIYPNIPDAPTQHKLVRQALNYAVDKELIAKQVYRGLTKPAQGQVLQQTSFGFNPNLKPYPYDPAKARQLLAQAGYPNGFSIKISLATFVLEGEAAFLVVQQQFRDIGVNLEIVRYSDAAQFLDRWYGRAPREHLLSVSLRNGPTLDGATALVWFRGTQPPPVGFYNNPAFDEAMKASDTEMNPQRRAELIQRAVAAMHEDPPYLFLVEGLDAWMASPNVANVIPRADGDPAMEIVTPK